MESEFVSLGSLRCINSRISNIATVSGRSEVSGGATISDESEILNESIVSGGAIISDGSIVSDRSEVSGGAVVSGKSKILDMSKVSGGSIVSDRSEVSGGATISGGSIILGSAIKGKVEIIGLKIVNGKIIEFTDDRKGNDEELAEYRKKLASYISPVSGARGASL